MAQHLSLRAVQQSLAGRGIRMSRDGSYADGRSRFAVWPNGRPRITGRTTDDIEHGYILGLRMASANDRQLGFA